LILPFDSAAIPALAGDDLRCYSAQKGQFWQGVINYDISLPVAFHCPHCNQTHRLGGGEAEKQTPKDFLPSFLSFRCPRCQTVLKANLGQSHWVNDASDRKSVFVLDRIELA
jgi:hypothetical protein